MNLDRAQDIIDGYASWWRNEVVASQAGSAIQLVCPMLNRNNDHMSFYIADDPSQPGGFLLTDMGVTWLFPAAIFLVANRALAN